MSGGPWGEPPELPDRHRRREQKPRVARPRAREASPPGGGDGRALGLRYAHSMRGSSMRPTLFLALPLTALLGAAACGKAEAPSAEAKPAPKVADKGEKPVKN